MCVCVCVRFGFKYSFIDNVKMKFMSLEESWVGGHAMRAYFWVREGVNRLLVGLRAFNQM